MFFHLCCIDLVYHLTLNSTEDEIHSISVKKSAPQTQSVGTQCGGSPLAHNISQSLSPSASMSPPYPSTPNSPSGFETPSFTPHPPVEVDAQTESNHDTALTIACAGGYDDVVQMLLEKSAAIEHRDKKGNVLYLYGKLKVG